MNRDETVKAMAKMLCPKGTANCGKCSKNYKCNVNFSQLSQLFDGGCRIIGDDEVVLTKGAYESLSNKAKENVVKALAIKQETTREILQEILCTKSCEEWFENEQLVDFGRKIVDKIDDIANKYGIEIGGLIYENICKNS